MCIQHILPFNHYDDDEEYLEVVYDLLTKNPPPPFDVLQAQNRLFTPFELNEDMDLPLNDIDPDVQYYNSQCNMMLNSCDYYVEKTLNQKLSDLKINKDCWSLIHENIRSIPHNLDKFDNYLASLEHEFSVIALTETWLKDHSVDLYGIDGYESEHRIRTTRDGGGVSLYIKNTIL